MQDERSKQRHVNKYERLKEKAQKETDNITEEESKCAEEIKKKWVVNISDRELSSDENSVLSHGLNFAV